MESAWGSAARPQEAVTASFNPHASVLPVTAV